MSYGALTPSEIDFLSDIIKRHCEAHGIRSAEGREDVAASALMHYQRGITDHARLLDILAAEDDPQRSVTIATAGASEHAP